ncbi:translation initiation factor IF-3 [Oenococcus alcoholitolerans]|uniref:translation initiation factor IF-3 n=1 Tax=Oenococcus alcoholitolerans TaxID=931074 RepID=UPI003F6F89D0
MLIDNGSKKVINTREAQRIAESRNLDLVIVQAKAQPPVARIMDWGKVKFEQQKKARENKKKQVIVQIKEVRLSPVIGEGDFETRKKAATKFLTAGNKVKLNLRFRGRMMTHQNVGRDVLMKMADQLKDLANIDQMPKLLGRQMSLLLSPKPEVIKKVQSEKKNKLKEKENAKNED